MTDRTTPPPLRPLTDICLPAPRRIVTPRGIPMCIIDAKDTDLVRLSLRWDGGKADFDNTAAAGILFEVMQEGSADYSAAAIADAIDYAGARMGGRPSEHHCGIDLIVLRSRLGRLLPMLESVIARPEFADESVAMVCRRTASICAVDSAKVPVVASNLIKPLIYGAGKPLSRIIVPEDYSAVTPHMLRQIHSATYLSAPLHVFVAGNIDDATLRMLTDFVDSLPAAAATAASPIRVCPMEPEAPHTVGRVMPEARQSALCMAIPTIGRSHPEYIKLRLAVMALGGYFGSRLMQNIREERGLTYGISASLQGLFEGAFAQIEAQCAPESVDEVIEQSKFEINRLVTQPPAGDELQRLKLKAWMALAGTTDSPLTVLGYYITMLTVGTDSDYFARQIETIRQLRPDDIAAMASSYLDPSLWSVAVAGPETDTTVSTAGAGTEGFLPD